MKRFLLILLSLILTVQGAFAFELGEGLEAQVKSVVVEPVPEKDTYTRISVNMLITNWDLKTMNLLDEIHAKLIFADKYRFAGDLSFNDPSIDPLVQLEGSVLFDVPNMVLDVPEEIAMSIEVAGKDISGTIGDLPFSAKGGLGERFEGEGFSTPEEAALTYVQALKNQDVFGALSTFAIESFVENVSFDAYVERIKAFSALNMNNYVPVDNPYYKQVKSLRRLSDIVQSMSMGYLTQIWDESFEGDIYSNIIFKGDDTAGQIEKFRNTLVRNAEEFQIESITIHGIANENGIFEIPEIYYSENNARNLSRQGVSLGCDELRDVVVHFSIDGEDYLQFMQCMRYGDIWYNYQLGGNLALLVNLNTACGGMVALEAFEQ